MRRAALATGVLIILSTLALWDTARAEEARVYVAVYGGLAFPEDLTDVTLRPGNTSVPNLELSGLGDDDDNKLDGTIMGGKVGFIPERDFTWFGLEAEVFVAPTRIKRGEVAFGGEALTAVTVAFNSILRWPKGPIQPYLGIGPSIVFSDGIGGQDSAFGLNMLVGTRILLGSRAFIFGEAKLNQSELDFDAATVTYRQQALVAGIALTF